MKLKLKTCEPILVNSTPSCAGGAFHVPVEEGIETEVCTTGSIRTHYHSDSQCINCLCSKNLSIH